MSCWMPSNSQEAWFPQLRTNRLEREAAETAAKERAAKARAKRKTVSAPAQTED